MKNSTPKRTVGTVIPVALADDLKRLAEARRWSVARFLEFLIEREVQKKANRSAA